MIYGASGFAGRRILAAALERGLRPVVAGRSEGPVRALADRHRLPSRVFPLTDPGALAEGLKGVDLVLNAAGPATAEHLARACIAHGVHCLDIGCELRSLRRLAAMDDAAHEAGVAVIAGAGFSPAVAEALALHLKRRLPGAVRLTIALCAPVQPSPGLIRSGLEIALRPSAALRRGRIKTMRRRRLRRFDFGRGPEPCYGLGWGELAAVHRATGVRNVDFFVRARPDLARLLRLSPVLAACRRLPFLHRRFDSFAEAHGEPPSGRRGRSRLVGYAYDPAGRRAASRVHLPDPWTVTAQLAAVALARAAATPVSPGVQSAAQFLGSDFLAEMPGLHVDWEELELSAPGDLKLCVRRRVPLARRLARLWPGRKRAEEDTAVGDPGTAGKDRAEPVPLPRKPVLQPVGSGDPGTGAEPRGTDPSQTDGWQAAVEGIRRTG
ncbi:MAG: saccharopine dehydrogenase NADP-binding domain-containing protein [bacterium]